MSSTLEADLVHAGTLVALELKDDLAGSLDVLLEDGLGLTTKTGLLTVITTLTYKMKMKEVRISKYQWCA